MTDKLHEVWWDLVLVVLKIVRYFLAGKFEHGYFESLPPGSVIYVRTRNIFVAYAMVKRRQELGFYAEWEPAK